MSDVLFRMLSLRCTFGFLAVTLAAGHQWPAIIVVLKLDVVVAVDGPGSLLRRAVTMLGDGNVPVIEYRFVAPPATVAGLNPPAIGTFAAVTTTFASLVYTYCV